MTNWVCVLRGSHVVTGSGWGTNYDAVMWSTHCRDCGVRILPPIPSSPAEANPEDYYSSPWARRRAWQTPSND